MKRILPLGLVVLAITGLIGLSAYRHQQAVTPLHAATFPGHIGYPEFSPDGRLLALVMDQGVALWDVAGWKQTKLLPCDARYIYWTPNGKELITLGDHEAGPHPYPYHPEADVMRWDVASGKPLMIIPIHNASAYFFSMSISSDLTMLFVQGTQQRPAQVWDIVAGKMILSLPYRSLWEANFSSDHRFLVGVVSRKKSDLHLWDVKTWQELSVLKGQTDGVRCACFSPDSKLLATGTEKQITLWNTTTWQPVRVLPAKFGDLFRMRFSHDGTRLGAGGRFENDEKKTFDFYWMLWNPLTGKQITEIHHSYFWGFLPGSRLIITENAGEPTTQLNEQNMMLWNGTMGERASGLTKASDL